MVVSLHDLAAIAWSVLDDCCSVENLLMSASPSGRRFDSLSSPANATPPRLLSSSSPLHSPPPPPPPPPLRAFFPSLQLSVPCSSLLSPLSLSPFLSSSHLPLVSRLSSLVSPLSRLSPFSFFSPPHLPLLSRLPLVSPLRSEFLIFNSLTSRSDTGRL